MFVNPTKSPLPKALNNLGVLHRSDKYALELPMSPGMLWPSAAIENDGTFLRWVSESTSQSGASTV